MVSLDPNKPTVGQIEEKVNTTPGVLDLDALWSGRVCRTVILTCGR